MSEAAPTTAAPNTIPPPRRLSAWTTVPAVRLGAVLVLVVLFQVPLWTVSGLVSEREGRQDEVLSGIRRSWGPAQAVAGPSLAVPYTWTEPATPGVPERQLRAWVTVPPRTLAVHAALAPQSRQRGLFRATVYTARVDLQASLAIPDIQLPDKPNLQLLWPNAVISVGASDLRGQPADGTMTVDNRSQRLTLGSSGCGAEATVPAGLAAAPAPGTTLAVATTLTLRGTQSFEVRPTAGAIDMQVTSPWTTPSFTGAALPLDYNNTKDGFRADWQVTGDPGYASWTTDTSRTACTEANPDADVGVSLLDAVPTYLMVTRAAKYGTLFLALSFLTYFLIEQGTGIRIHLAQYALLGLSVSLFALILLAVAEPLGFTAGYAAATAAVVAQASLYTLSITARSGLAALLAGVLATLFGLLYVILRLETYALLAGTTALFAILSVVMAATRRLDWSGRTADTAPNA